MEEPETLRLLHIGLEDQQASTLGGAALNLIVFHKLFAS